MTPVLGCVQYGRVRKRDLPRWEPTRPRSVVDPVPIHQILQNAGFASADAEALLVAFDSVCRELGLASDNMPMRNLVALKVVDLAIRGERDPNQVALVVLAELRDTGALGASDAKP